MSRFNVGDWVEVTHVYIRKMAFNEREWFIAKLKEPVKAVVTGRRRIYDGLAEREYDEYTGKTYHVGFSPTEAHEALLVRTGWHNTEAQVPIDKVKKISEPEKGLPYQGPSIGRQAWYYIEEEEQ